MKTYKVINSTVTFTILMLVLSIFFYTIESNATVLKNRNKYALVGKNVKVKQDAYPAKTIKDYRTMIKLIKKKDLGTLQKMIFAGQMTYVMKGETVKVEKYNQDIGAYKIQVAGTPNSWWIMFPHIYPQNVTKHITKLETAIFIDPYDLKVGQKYILSRQTLLMPNHSPNSNWLSKTQRFSKGSIFKIISKKEDGHRFFYQVQILGKNDKIIAVGWFNSVALVGQDLKLKK